MLYPCGEARNVTETDSAGVAGPEETSTEAESPRRGLPPAGLLIDAIQAAATVIAVVVAVVAIVQSTSAIRASEEANTVALEANTLAYHANGLSRDANANAAAANDLASTANATAAEANRIARLGVVAQPTVRWVQSVGREWGDPGCVTNDENYAEVDWAFSVDISNQGGAATALVSLQDDSTAWVNGEFKPVAPPPGVEAVDISTLLNRFYSAAEYQQWLSQQGPWLARYDGTFDYGLLPLALPPGHTSRIGFHATSFWHWPPVAETSGALQRALVDDWVTVPVTFSFANGTDIKILVPMHTPPVQWLDRAPPPNCP